MASLILHELTGSPNNVKARIALGYKGLDYDRNPAHLHPALHPQNQRQSRTDGTCYQTSARYGPGSTTTIVTVPTPASA